MEALLILTKVPCLILATIGLHTTATPPRAPPAKSEEAPSTSWEIVVKQRAGPTVIKLICWLATLAEITVIFAQTVGAQTVPQSVQQALGMPLASEKLSPSPMFFLGTGLAVVGGYIRYSCYRELGSLFTFEMSIMKEHKLITTGPYAWVRHPAYTGVLCCVSGIALIHGSSGSWAKECGALDTLVGKVMALVYLAGTSLITIGLLKRIPKEDEALKVKFGSEWEAWARRVPFRLFWGIY